MTENFLDQFFKLYFLVFQKSKDEIESQIKWHKNSPGTVHYFFGLEKDQLVSFNYFLQFKGPYFTYALSGGSITHPERKGSFIPLFQFATEKMIKIVDLLIGFCNNNSFRVFCHPIIGWREHPDFIQFTLTETINEKRLDFNFRFASINDITNYPSAIIPFNRDAIYCSWRVQRVSGLIILKNQESKAISILKPFDRYFDLITILNVASLNDYITELLHLHHFLKNHSSSFSGVNIYSSFPQIEALLSQRFRLEHINYERHLCYKTESRTPSFQNLYIEMIDSDLF